MLFFASLYKKFQRDNALFLARGLAFDVMVCLVPAFFLLFLFFGLLFESPKETIRFILPSLKPLIPFSTQKVLLDLLAIVRIKKVIGLLGFIGLFWTLSRVFGSIRTVLEVVFQVKDRRGILRAKIFDFKMMLLASLFFLATVLITSFFSLVKRASTQLLGMKFLWLGFRGEILTLLLAFSFTVLMFFCLYRYVPAGRTNPRTAWYAAFAASLLWELAKQGFRLYLFQFADLTKIYGSFSLLFALIFWIYYSCIVFILGAEMGWLWERKKQ